MFGTKIGRVALVASLALIAALGVGLWAGIGGASTAREETGHKMYFLPKLLHPAFTSYASGGFVAAKELGDTMTYRGPTTPDATKLIPLINSAVQQDYDAILISTPDANAVAPALRRAEAKGVTVVSYDSDTAPDARSVFVSGPSVVNMGMIMLDLLARQIRYRGEIAILSSGPTNFNQNAWIKVIKKALTTPKYKNVKLVKVAYGFDDPAKSATAAQGLLTAYPNLKGIIGPTGVALPVAAQVLTQQGKCGEIKLTGLATPLSMKQYVKTGCVPSFAFWNAPDFGYLAFYTAHALLTGKIKGKVGETFTAGHLGKLKLVRDYGTTPVVTLEPPLVFTKKNINKFNF